MQVLGGYRACPKCGYRNCNEADYCIKCGSRLSGDEYVTNYDSRWRWPDIFGYGRDDPEWGMLQRAYMDYTGDVIDEDGRILYDGTPVPGRAE